MQTHFLSRTTIRSMLNNYCRKFNRIFIYALSPRFSESVCDSSTVVNTDKIVKGVLHNVAHKITKSFF